MEAVRRGDEFAVKEFIAVGADFTTKNRDGESALSIARDLVVGRKPSHDRIAAFLARIGTEQGLIK